MNPTSRRRASSIVRLALIPLLALIALAGWALGSPVGASPDDDYHLTSIWCADGLQAGVCEKAATADAREVPYLVARPTCYVFHAEVSASCQLTKHPLDASTTRGNFDGMYPPFFYGTMRAFVTSDVLSSVVTMRIVNSILFVGLASLVCWLLPARRRTTLFWGIAGSIVPLGVFIIASVNPSSWAVLSGGIVFVATAGYFESAGWRKIGLGASAVVAAFLGGGARSDAAIYAVIAAGAGLLVTIAWNKRFWLSALLPLGIAVMSAVLFRLGSQAEGAFNGGWGPPHMQGSTLNVAFRTLIQLPSLYAGSFGVNWGLGWLDTLMPAIVWFPALAVFLALIFAGLRSMNLWKGIALAGVVLVLFVVPFYLLVHGRFPVGEQIQPRYLTPLIMVLLAVALWQVGGTVFRLTRVQWWAIVVSLAVANSIALHENIRRYVTGTDVPGFNLSSHVEWWWPISLSPMWAWVIASVAFAGALVLALLEFSPEARFRIGRRGADGTAPEPHDELRPVEAL